jgi:hypothetical protein
MERISLENKTSFFEHRVTEYARAKVGKTNVYEFNMNAPF